MKIKLLHQDLNRRKFAATLSIMDESVGQVVAALQEKNMLQVFYNPSIKYQLQF